MNRPATRAQIFIPRSESSPRFRPRSLMDHQKPAVTTVNVRPQTVLRTSKSVQRRRPVAVERLTTVVAKSIDHSAMIMSGKNRGNRKSVPELGYPPIDQ